jgi:hypothetical protein
MKYRQTHFEEYLTENEKYNLHPTLAPVYEKNFPPAIQDLKNLIFYGPSGIGKYTQVLSSIQKYSPSDLKYEKKISVVYNKKQYFFKISDIHFEIDVSLLGCNSKLLWHDIYLQILDAISAKSDKTGIIVCRNFHEIHNELLENFYSYMQQNNLNVIHVIFILVTDEISFIPDNILNCCQVISMARPKKTEYNKIVKLPKDAVLSNISNIKALKSSQSEEAMHPHKMICNKIIKQLLNIGDLKFAKFREMLYDIFIYNLNITTCVWYILKELKENKIIHGKQMWKDIMLSTFTFFQYYNNNYRPIYHLEKYMLQLASVIHTISLDKFELKEESDRK